MNRLLKNNKGALAYLLAIILVLLIVLKLLVCFHATAKTAQGVITQGQEQIMSIDKSLQ